RRMPRAQDVARMTTQELRDSFVVGKLFEPGQVNGTFTDLDRLVVGGIMPAKPVELPNHKETGRAFFLERRELGAINTGGPGNVWNSFPPHTHWRRTEIYFYFDLGEKVLAHFMGEPQATRHLFLHDDDAVLSPNWSIHCGCGSGNYKFIWGMAGENQVFDDMDAVKPLDLR